MDGSNLARHRHGVQTGAHRRTLRILDRMLCGRDALPCYTKLEQAVVDEVLVEYELCGGISRRQATALHAIVARRWPRIAASNGSVPPRVLAGRKRPRRPAPEFLVVEFTRPT